MDAMPIRKLTIPEKTLARNLWFLGARNTADIALAIGVHESVVYNDRSWQTMGEIRR